MYCIDGISSWKRSKTRNERLRDASQSGDLSEIKLLIRDNININDDDTYGLSALHLACQSNHIDIIRELLYNGADVNCKDKYGVTPLILAAQRCSYDSVSLLLQYKATVNQQSIYGHTALIKCVSNPTQHSKIITQLLLSHKAKTELHDNQSELTALHYAVRCNNIACVSTLVLDGHANINAVDRDGNTSCMIAAYESHWLILQELIALGADITIVNKANHTLIDIYNDEHGLTPEQYIKHINESITAGQTIAAKRAEQKLINEQKRIDAQAESERRRNGTVESSRTNSTIIRRIDVSSLLMDDTADDDVEQKQQSVVA